MSQVGRGYIKTSPTIKVLTQSNLSSLIQRFLRNFSDDSRATHGQFAILCTSDASLIILPLGQERVPIAKPDRCIRGPLSVSVLLHLFRLRFSPLYTVH